MNAMRPARLSGWLAVCGLMVWMLAIAGVAHAQNVPNAGVWGYGSIGMTSGAMTGLDQVINDVEGFEDAKEMGPGLTLGAGVKIFGSNGVMIGVRARMMVPPAIEVSKGQTDLLSFGGGWDAGFIILNRRGWMLYPLIAVDLYRQRLNVRHDDPRPLTKFGEVTMIRGQTTRFFGTSVAVEVGMGFQHFTGDWGGLIFGAEIGARIMSTGSWGDVGGDTVGDIGSVQATSAFVRLTVGGAHLWRW